MKEEFIKLAKIARTDPEVIEQVSLKMSKITGKENVIEGLVEDIELKVIKKLAKLNLEKPTADQVQDALMNKMQENDEKLFSYFNSPDFNKSEGYQKVLDGIKDIVGPKPGFYLKKEKALNLFRKSPPKNIMNALGYTDLEKMLDTEDWFELFAALRIVEDSKWVNTVFFAALEDIKADDFEERDIKYLALPDKWADIAKKFTKKKLHHMSHLKEMGLVFVIPMGASGALGELIYLVFMTMHYLYEVDWHSKLFKGYSQRHDFYKKMVDALKVETSSDPLLQGEKMSFRIAPSYLAKKDLSDPRLKEPRISPEDWHYIKAAKDIKKLAQKNPDLGLDFWDDLHYVAGYFPSKDEERLIAFNMFDVGVALLKKTEIEIKYIYHQMDALWNEIAIRYIGEDELNKLMMENLDKGSVVL